jgi:D-alanyl-D-alanine carboxypeptidase
VLLKSGVSTDYGLGVDVDMTSGHRTIGHTGEVAGFTAANMVFPDDSAAVVVLTNQDAASASSLIAGSIGRTLFTTEDASTEARAVRARAIFGGLQHGTIDRSLLTDDASAYFSAQALTDFQTTLAPLGSPTSFVQTAQHERGGMLERIYRVTFNGRALRVWTYEMPDGKLEQYQLTPTG